MGNKTEESKTASGMATSSLLNVTPEAPHCWSSSYAGSDRSEISVLEQDKAGIRHPRKQRLHRHQEEDSVSSDVTRGTRVKDEMGVAMEK